jgi:hypothetical protein
MSEEHKPASPVVPEILQPWHFLTYVIKNSIPSHSVDIPPRLELFRIRFVRNWTSLEAFQFFVGRDFGHPFPAFQTYIPERKFRLKHKTMGRDSTVVKMKASESLLVKYPFDLAGLKNDIPI